jgi:hypothetical protein
MCVEICRVLACHSICFVRVQLMLMSRTFQLYTHQHYINAAYMGLDRCQIIGYAGLSDGIYCILTSVLIVVTASILGPHN